MRRKISEFLREYIFILSIITIVIGFIITIFGVLGTWFQDNIKDILGSIEEIYPWSPYIFIIGLIILGAGIYYLYMFLSKKNFLIKEIETNKRSEFIKNHAELKTSVKYLPSKYKELLKQKEKEFKIK
jgi:H+/Cl- antiporter ClcA